MSATAAVDYENTERVRAWLEAKLGRVTPMRGPRGEEPGEKASRRRCGKPVPFSRLEPR